VKDINNNVSSDKNAEASAKFSITLNLVLHTIAVFILACIMMYAFIRFGKLWIISVGLMLAVAITVHTNNGYQRCLSDFCNNHVRIVNYIAEHLSCAFSVMQDQQKTLSKRAMEVLQSLEALARFADEVEAMSNLTEGEDQNTAQKNDSENSKMQ
jgi:hypothetical protein